MATTFGNFIEINASTEYVMISFLSTHSSIRERWRNNSLLADFLATHWGNCYPELKCPSQRSYPEIKDLIRYVANELLENAVKFDYALAQTPLRISMYSFVESLRYYVTNSLQPQAARQFQQYLEILLTEDPATLYIHQLERNARDEGGMKSHIGYLTMLHDYQVQLAWKFDVLQLEPEIITVTTMAQLNF
jgi:hypothetical protein